ncbi:hypothetical protein QEN19_002502 [Hanseniaspora menglaensis]
MEDEKAEKAEKPKIPSTKHKYKFNTIKPLTFNTRNKRAKDINSNAQDLTKPNSNIRIKRQLTTENSLETKTLDLKNASLKINDFFGSSQDVKSSSPNTKRAKYMLNSMENGKDYQPNNIEAINNIDNSNHDDSLITYGINNYKKNKNQTMGSNPANSIRKVSVESNITSGSSPLKIVSSKLILENDLMNFESIGKSSPIKSVRSFEMSKSQQRRILLKKSSPNLDKDNRSHDTSSLIFGLNSSLHIENTEANTSHKNIKTDQNPIELSITPPKLSPEKKLENKTTQSKLENKQNIVDQIKELYGSDAFETSDNTENNENDNTKSTVLRTPSPAKTYENNDNETTSDSSDDDFLFELHQKQVLKNQEKRESSNINKSEQTMKNLITQQQLDLLKCSRLQSKPHFLFLRLLILEINSIEYNHILIKCCNSEKKIYSIHLYPPWTQDFTETDSPYRLNEIIHITSFNVDDPILLMETEIHLTLKSKFLLVVEPDTLLSGTTLADGLTCQRQTVIKRRFGLPSEPSIHLTRGTIIHELFQNLLQLITKNHNDSGRCRDILSTENLSNMLTGLINKYQAEIIISTDQEVKEFQYTLETDFFPNIKQFMLDYIMDKPRNGFAKISTQRSGCLSFNIKNIHNIEETIDSPLFGLKGIVDATINTNIGFIPMEIKTGKAISMKHQTQTLIYALLQWEKYDSPVEYYLLVYLGGPGTYTLSDVSFNEFKMLLHFRNKMISYFKDERKDHGTLLPELLKGSSATCERECGAQEICTILNHVSRMDNQSLNSQTIDENVLLSKEFVDFVVGDISFKEKQFFERYYKMLQLEDEANAFEINAYFLQSSNEKEECIGMMKLLETKKVKISDEGDENYELSFSFDNMLKDELNGLSVNDRCILSDEMGHYRLDYVTVTEIDYGKGFLKTFGTKDVMKSTQSKYKNIVLFRLDIARYDMPNKIAKFNIASLLNRRNTNLKNLIIHPEYNLNTQVQSYFKSFNIDMINWKQLNVDQSEALKKCLSSDKYSLIRGMPGTGKTQVITELLKCLVSNGKTVLITSFTHSAVDNIILKLVENNSHDENFNIVRLGQKGNINKKVHRFMITNNIKEHLELKNKYKTTNVVATTCLSVNSFMVKEILRIDNESEVPEYNKFDYCILDEATQVNLPISLAPLEWSKKFILVGDDNQLSPLVKSKEAIKLGLKESLFSKLSNIDPSNVSNLTIQYRMNEDIMRLSNFLVYNNELKCGEINKNRYLPVIDNLHAKFSKNTLEYKILDNKQSILFIDYKNEAKKDSLYCDQMVKDSLVNVGEVQIISQVLKLYKENYSVNNSHFNPIDDIGILSIYRGQLNYLEYTLNTGTTNLGTQRSQHEKHLEILTADQFQGRDKKCIIISFVKSSAHEKEHKTIDDGILNDLERINVSITRSKCKLIMVGNSDTLSRYTVINKLFDGIIFKEKDKYVYEI